MKFTRMVYCGKLQAGDYDEWTVVNERRGSKEREMRRGERLWVVWTRGVVEEALLEER